MTSIEDTNTKVVTIAAIIGAIIAVGTAYCTWNSYKKTSTFQFVRLGTEAKTRSVAHSWYPCWCCDMPRWLLRTARNSTDLSARTIFDRERRKKTNLYYHIHKADGSFHSHIEADFLKLKLDGIVHGAAGTDPIVIQVVEVPDDDSDIENQSLHNVDRINATPPEAHSMELQIVQGADDKKDSTYEFMRLQKRYESVQVLYSTPAMIDATATEESKLPTTEAYATDGSTPATSKKTATTEASTATIGPLLNKAENEAASGTIFGPDETRRHYFVFRRGEYKHYTHTNFVSKNLESFIADSRGTTPRNTIVIQVVEV